MNIQTPFTLASVYPLGAWRSLGLRLRGLRQFQAFLASSPCAASATSYHFSSIALPWWRSAFSRFVLVVNLEFPVLASGSNRAVKPTCLRQAAYFRSLVRGNVMYLAFIGTLGFLVTISTAALAETLIEKSSQFGADFTSTELVAIFMAEVAYCEAKAPEFKKQAAMPLAKLRATKKFQDISNSPNFAKLSIEASELVSKRHADSGAGSCMNKLESVRHELQRFQQ